MTKPKPKPAPEPENRPVTGLDPTSDAVRDTRFKAGGPSPNPGGRPAIAKAVREKLRQYLTEPNGGIDKLIAMANSGGKESPRALELVLAYGLGRPTQPVSGADPDEEHSVLEIVITRPATANTEAPRD